MYVLHYPKKYYLTSYPYQLASTNQRRVKFWGLSYPKHISNKKQAQQELETIKTVGTGQDILDFLTSKWSTQQGNDLK